MREWDATCPVCGTSWTVETSEDVGDPPGPTFCEDCRERKLMAPGVLTWKERYVLTEKERLKAENAKLKREVNTLRNMVVELTERALTEKE